MTPGSLPYGEEDVDLEVSGDCDCCGDVVNRGWSILGLVYCDNCTAFIYSRKGQKPLWVQKVQATEEGWEPVYKWHVKIRRRAR